MEEINYFIKVRSRDGAHPCFGFLRGEIRFGYDDNRIPSVGFTYYVNPDGTKNIEFDPSRNLIKTLGRHRTYEYQAGYPR